VTPAQYKKHIDKLKPNGSSTDDKRRCAKRKALLLTEHFNERKSSQSTDGEEVGGFTGRDLTQTSHLNKLAALTAQRVLGIGSEKVLHLPGSVTGAIRKSWDLLGTLAKANPQVLDESGKPQVALAFFSIPADSPFMIESKSFKLYLNSLNYQRVSSTIALAQMMMKDLSEAAGADVAVDIEPLHSDRAQVSLQLASQVYRGAVCVDKLEAPYYEYQPNADLLRVIPGAQLVNETLYSNLLRSNCPVTGQPDWASVYIHYSGQQIDQVSLLQYIVSFRQCQEFHEHCVERIFVDLLQRCQCDSLSVHARYTRRGGLDINPYRATPDLSARAPKFRTSRQ